MAAPDAMIGLDPERWLDAHGDALYRHALQRTGNPQTAEDLVQETLLAAWRGRERYRGEARERTWLIGILHHKVADYVRSQVRMSEVDLALDERHSVEDAIFDEGGAWRTKPGLWGDDPLSTNEAEAFMDTLNGCLENLSPAQKTTFQLREIDNVDISDTTQTLGISRNHVYVLLHRARLAVRRCLEKRWFGGAASS